MGANAEDIGLAMHAHPTLAETFACAAESVAGAPITGMPPRRRAAWPTPNRLLDLASTAPLDMHLCAEEAMLLGWSRSARWPSSPAADHAQPGAQLVDTLRH